MLSLYERAPEGWGGDLFRPDGPDLVAPHARIRLGSEAPPRAAAGDVQPPPRHPLRLRRLRRPRRPAAVAPQTPARQRRHPRVPAHDPLLLLPPAADLLDPGRPLGQLDPRYPRLRRRQQHRARPDPTYASYLNRIEAHFRPINEFVVSNADYLDWDAFAHALARHIQHRNGPDRDRRIAALERKLTITA